jgi:hypothetical protein
MKVKKFIPGTVLTALGLEMFREFPIVSYIPPLAQKFEGAWRVGNSFLNIYGRPVDPSTLNFALEKVTTSVPPDVIPFSVINKYLLPLIGKIIDTPVRQYGSDAAVQQYLQYAIHQLNVPEFITGFGIGLLGSAALYEGIRHREEIYSALRNAISRFSHKIQAVKADKIME